MIPRFIEATEAIRVLSEYYHHRTDTKRYVLAEAISRVPTVDAVLVVRCKDCKWRDNPTAHMWLPCKEIKPKNDWFCADGERKEGKQDG